MTRSTVQRGCTPRVADERGFSLIELMIALTIGVVIVLAATRVFENAQRTYAIREVTGRLQETARYALSVIEPDVRMANYWGLVKGSVTVTGGVAQTAAANTAFGGTSASACGNNYSLDVGTEVEGSNDAYALGCAAFGAGAVASADTVTIRRAAVNPTTVAANVTGPLRICSTRIAAQLVNNATGCTTAPAGQVFDLVVDTYYVSRDSVQATGVPALRRWTLNGTPAFVDNEIVSGVEDLQVQFGIDPTGNTGVATQYVDAFNAAAMPANAQIVAVRIFLLVRADTPEIGFRDTRTYEYGNRRAANGTTSNLNAANAAGRAYAPNDQFRRLLVSRTIMLRNALGT